MNQLDLLIQENKNEGLLKLVQGIYQTDTILPDNAAFFLGYALFKKEQYKQSI